ncbi:MAG TPA: methyltransferase domain-containing protein, partial [Actinomycetota bacterium]
MRLFRRKPSTSGPAESGSAGRSAETAGKRDQADWRTYDDIAGAYARVHAPRMALPAGDLVELARITDGAQVLDVGTGTGVVAREAARIASPDGRVVGVDASIGMLNQAAPAGGGPLYAAATAIDLPFRDQTFTHVLA